MRIRCITADVPNACWQLDERLCLDILNTEYANTKVEGHNIFGRIFGQRWKNAKRRPYIAQRLHEEYQWRWNDGKSMDWDLVCVPIASRTPLQQTERDQMRQQIVDAAAQSGSQNLFTKEADSSITLITSATPYVETGRPNNKKRKGAPLESSRKAPSTPTLASAIVAPTTSGFIRNGPEPGDSSADPSHAADTHLPKRASPKKRATVKAGPDQDHPTHPSRSPEKSMPPPSIVVTDTTVGNAALENAPSLQMVHTCFVDLSVFPPTFQQGNTNRFISKGSKLYRYGGFVKRMSSSDGKTFDAMICTKSLCSFCQNYEQYTGLSHEQAQILASRAENADWIPENSPLCGFPFVHVSRDCDRDPEPNPGNRYTFSPRPPKPTSAPELPTWTSQIAFDDSQNGAEDGSGCFGFRETGLCDPALCYVCKISDEQAAELLAGEGPVPMASA